LHIIPVIDLLNGVCVHAKQGLRAQYQPIHSALTHSCQPLDIVKAFMAIYPFKTLYIADLNAIQSIDESSAVHTAIYTEIKQHFPQLELWVDAGINTIERAKHLQSLGMQLVLGSESFQTFAHYQTLQKQIGTAFTLSLDFHADGYRGPSRLLARPETWPENIIAMTLSKVGSNTGVDFGTIDMLVKKNPQQQIYAAGGIRHLSDLQTLKSQGIKGALIASALHVQALTGEEIESLQA